MLKVICVAATCIDEKIPLKKSIIMSLISKIGTGSFEIEKGLFESSGFTVDNSVCIIA